MKTIKIPAVISAVIIALWILSSAVISVGQQAFAEMNGYTISDDVFYIPYAVIFQLIAAAVIFAADIMVFKTAEGEKSYGSAPVLMSGISAVVMPFGTLIISSVQNIFGARLISSEYLAMGGVVNSFMALPNALLTVGITLAVAAASVYTYGKSNEK